MKSPNRVHRAWRLSPETDQSLKRWSKVLGVSETRFVESAIQIVSEGLENSATRLKTRVANQNSSEYQTMEEQTEPL